MKNLDLHLNIIKIIKNLEIHTRIMKIIKIIEIRTSGLRLSGPPPGVMEWFKRKPIIVD